VIAFCHVILRVSDDNVQEYCSLSKVAYSQYLRFRWNQRTDDLSRAVSPKASFLQQSLKMQLTVYCLQLCAACVCRATLVLDVAVQMDTSFRISWYVILHDSFFYTWVSVLGQISLLCFATNMSETSISMRVPAEKRHGLVREPFPTSL